MSYQSEVLADAPLIYWKLDDRGAVDAQGGPDWIFGAGVVPGGAPIPNDGGTSIHGGGADAIARRSDIPASLAGANISVSLWVNIPSTDVAGAFATVGANTANGWGVGVGGTSFDGAGKQLILLHESVAWKQTGFTLSAGKHHIAVTRSAADLFTAYVDGVSVWSGTFTPVAPTGGMAIGGTSTTSRALSATVDLDDVAWFASTLSASTIGAIYNGGSGSPAAVASANPAIWLKLDAASALVVSDASGNGRDGAHIGKVTPSQPSLLGDGSGFAALYEGGYTSIASASWMDTSFVAVECRYKPRAADLTGTKPIVTRWGISSAFSAWLLWINNGKVEAYVYTGTGQKGPCVGATTLTAGTAYTLGMSYDGSNVRVYVNGVVDGTLAATGALATVKAPIEVARVSQATIGGGTVDEVSVMPGAISTARFAARHAAAISTTVSTTGTVNATAPTPTVAVSGDVADVVSGTVNATASAPTVAVTGDVPTPLTGTVNATASAPTLRVSDTAGLTLHTSAGSSTSIGPVRLTSLVAGFVAGAGSSTTIDASGILVVTPTVGIRSVARSSTRITIPRVWGINPRTNRPDVRVDITTDTGKPIMSLTAAQVAPLKDGVNVPDSWGITVPRASDQGKKIEPVACHAQLWRGNVLMSRGPIAPGRADGSSISYPVSDPSWYFRSGRRVIGRIPKRQLLRNADFTQGLAYWSGGYDKDSALKAPPTVKVVEDDHAMSGFALELGAVDKVVTTKTDVETSAVFVPNQATYLSGGEDKIRAVGEKIPDGSVVRITGFTANDGTGDGLALSLARAKAAKATLAAMGKKFVFRLPTPLRSPNMNDGTVAGRGYYEQIPGGLKPNRRVNIAYEGTQTATGHQQYERQFLTVTQPVEEKVPLTLTLAGEMKILRWDGAPKDGWALRMILHPYNNLAEDKILDEGTVSMDEATPRVRWADYQTSVEVPADGKPYTLEVRFYPPAGAARWVNVGLYPHDQLGFFDVDQALIVKALTEHVQDVSMGHGDLGIKTRTPLTGIPRTKEYPFHERMPWETAVEWFQAIDRGLDIDCEVTETTATIVTHYPRQGSTSDLDLVHGGSRSNVTAYRPLSTSTGDLASSIIMQADGSGAARPEAYARDTKALGGTLLEAVISAEDETPLSELDEGAVSELAKSLHPRGGWEVTIDPDATTAVLDAYRKGDTGRLVLPDEGIDGPHRMILREWNPATDVLTLTMIPEEV